MRKVKTVHTCLWRAAKGVGKRHEQGLKKKLRQELVSAMAARHGEAEAMSMNAGRNLLPCGEAQRGGEIRTLARDKVRRGSPRARQRWTKQGTIRREDLVGRCVCSH